MSDSELRVRRVPGSRRVVTAPPAGSDPHPQDNVRAQREPDAPSGNERQLLEDVPPHWGTHSH